MLMYMFSILVDEKATLEVERATGTSTETIIRDHVRERERERERGTERRRDGETERHRS